MPKLNLGNGVNKWSERESADAKRKLQLRKRNLAASLRAKSWAVIVIDVVHLLLAVRWSDISARAGLERCRVALTPLRTFRFQRVKRAKHGV